MRSIKRTKGRPATPSAAPSPASAAPAPAPPAPAAPARRPGPPWRTGQPRRPGPPGLDSGLRRGIALICLSVGVVGISYGAATVSAGFPLWLPVLTSATVLAASSEFLLTGILAAGGSPVAAVAAGLLVNARHLSYSLAIPDVIEPGWRRLAGTHLMNDETVVLALAQPGLARKRAVYRAAGAGIAVCWPGGALAGALLGEAAHGTSALGLDAVFPAATLALILPSLRDRATAPAALTGAAIALAAAPFLPPGLPELAALAGLALFRPRPGPGACARPEPEPPARPQPEPPAWPGPGAPG